jgi:hypothetical protein
MAKRTTFMNVVLTCRTLGFDVFKPRIAQAINPTSFVEFY